MFSKMPWATNLSLKLTSIKLCKPLSTCTAPQSRAPGYKLGQLRNMAHMSRPEFAPDPAWVAADEHLGSLFGADDDVLAKVLEANAKAGLPPIDVSPAQGKFLGLLVQISGAKRVLEIGTLGGYSTINFAKALPTGGEVVTLEISPKHAEVAQANIDNAGVSSKVKVVVGPALETLPKLEGPFDLVFIDADKVNMPNYLEHALRLSQVGTVIVGDNVIRKGRIVDAANEVDPNVRGARQFLQKVAENPRLTSTALQTVGIKGHDGFSISRVGI